MVVDPLHPISIIKEDDLRFSQVDQKSGETIGPSSITRTVCLLPVLSRRLKKIGTTFTYLTRADPMFTVVTSFALK
jgi:hypothetical protein